MTETQINNIEIIGDVLRSINTPTAHQALIKIFEDLDTNQCFVSNKAYDKATLTKLVNRALQYEDNPNKKVKDLSLDIHGSDMYELLDLFGFHLRMGKMGPQYHNMKPKQSITLEYSQELLEVGDKFPMGGIVIEIRDRKSKYKEYSVSPFVSAAV